jgi:hypothetical protein
LRLRPLCPFRASIRGRPAQRGQLPSNSPYHTFCLSCGESILPILAGESSCAEANEVAKRHRGDECKTVGWERVRAIFGNAPPLRTIREAQFDFFELKLKRLALTPYQEINFSDLWYYHHDLAYVELQPELFNYLFPVCLMNWHQSLLDNRPCTTGDADFHFAVHHGNVFEKMMTAAQREAVYEFFRDSFLERLDLERTFAEIRNDAPSASWIDRFNSLGIIMPRIDMIWNEWWKLATPGRAVAALQYCSCLMYFDGENPLFDVWKGVSPPLWTNDGFFFSDEAWREDNQAFLSQNLTTEFVIAKVEQATAVIESEPEREKACRLVADLPQCRQLIAERVRELPLRLRDPGANEWSV